MGGREGRDGEGAPAELQTGQRVPVQGEASEEPGNRRRGRADGASQTSHGASSLDQGLRLREEEGVLSW